LMVVPDAWAIAAVRRLPDSLVEAFNRLTDLGRSGWLLWPIGLVLLALALTDSPKLPRFPRAVIAAWSVRLGFVFAAIAVPGLFVAVIKRLIGRARPLIDGSEGWTYQVLGWNVEYASLPSGHATTAFSALVAIGAILPAARPLLWIYAVMIALSRVVVTAHHPSDVVAGAIVGAVGAIMVRNWFAARRLGFVLAADGTVRPLPGPSVRRIVKAIARRRRTA
jgi:membrane-associated phospholipid phosphatase